MFHWRIFPDRASDIERLERRVAALEARLGRRDTDAEPGSGRLEAALASLGRVVERAAANAEHAESVTRRQGPR
jgi:hypothetical protein